jgi:uncharacterized protein (TIGR02145 family)
MGLFKKRQLSSTSKNITETEKIKKEPFINITNPPTIQTSKTPETITDIDGNIYNIVKIGNQLWTKNNFHTTKFNDGSIIQLVTDETEWQNQNAPGLCWYDNNIENKNTYGALYNWFAIDTQQLAPKGWHVPTEAEWKILENYLITNGHNWDGTRTGNKIAKSLATQTGWGKETDDLGNIDNNQIKNNSSGFSGLAGGSRGSDGEFKYMGWYGQWWSSTVYSFSEAFARNLFCGEATFNCDFYNKHGGFSVRLLKDN